MVKKKKKTNQTNKQQQQKQQQQQNTRYNRLGTYKLGKTIAVVILYVIYYPDLD